tara:strand:+ start:1328 stop:2035 length:708 start_codon:yes stop_codon:yes gene_type:complete
MPIKKNNTPISFEYKIEDVYQSQNFYINHLFDLYGSDKGSLSDKIKKPYPWHAHTYGSYYSKLFDHCRDSIKLVFECGIGTNNPNLVSSMNVNGKPGASLRAWRDYFSNALIYGADIDNKILFEEDRIKTFFLDQTNKNDIMNMWSQINKSNFDLIVDDGLHTYKAAIIFFENSVQYLKYNGIYIIEDVQDSDLLEFKNYFDKKFSLYNYNILILKKARNKKSNNNLIEIRKIFK